MIRVLFIFLVVIEFVSGVDLPDEMKKQNRHIVELASKEISKTLPQTIDKYTKLIKVDKKDTTLIYIYEINIGSKSDESVKKEDHSRMKKAVTIGVCRSSKNFLDANINITYIYKNAISKAELFKFEMTKKSCLKIKQ